MTVEPIKFSLNQPMANASTSYRPWGTRVLKVKVSTDTSAPALRIRPSGVRTEEEKNGIFRAYADDSDAFIVSWGGGHEPGPCIQSKDFLKAFERCAEMEAGAASVIFFNLSHVGPELPDTATVTLEAYDEDSGEKFASLSIDLQKPESLPEQIVRFEKTGDGRWWPSAGMLPVYDPRWWPRPVTYVAPSSPLPLSIHREGLKLRVQWDGRRVATITDHTEPTILDTDALSFELFDFDKWHVALRTWFFWLDKNMGGDFFVGRHEVPDAERFDLLIRKQDGQVTLACTDLHWRETWGMVDEGDILEATLGLGLETALELAKENLEKLWAVWKREEKKDHTRPYNPISYIERMAERLGKQETGTVRDKGTEAHLPALHNVTQTDDGSRPPRMTSSDVRLV
jgi:hypothetical protein